MIHILGDGLAGTFLAKALLAEGVRFRQYGDGQTNTPPVAFVHLFQGRTFHRDPVEVEAFKVAVDHWRASPLSEEWMVRRSIFEGDRLDKSRRTDSVPLAWRPQQASTNLVEYGPGFTLESADLLRRMRETLKEFFQASRPCTEELQGTIAFASGLDIQNLLPELRWDTNPGRTVSAVGRENEELKPDYLYLNKGLHLGGNPKTQGFTLGGRVNSKGEAKNDEAELAEDILGEAVLVESEWWGKRIANALDRWPLVGWLDTRRFLFAGFGGRALFWLPYCTQIAERALREKTNEPIPPKLRADRFLKA